MPNIRNFCIIAHIDHGKSTLADRFLELTGTIEKRKMREQFLDQMELERERGITIKLQPVRMDYRYQGADYALNLIDTPGHIDFNYEVSRSLAAVEGAILLVDAVKGVQAQTLANLHLALRQKLAIIPVINKIDLPNARTEAVEEEIKSVLANQSLELTGGIIKCSAKNGTGVEKILAAVVERIPAPRSAENLPLRALVFDSLYDSYKGVVAYLKIVEGRVKKGDKVFFMTSQAMSEILEVGYFKPEFVATEVLRSGEIGYLVSGLKEVSKCRVGETIVLMGVLAEKLAGYQEPKPMVFASLYPVAGEDYEFLREALSKLKLNDASLIFEPESLSVLGRGFKCGFLGMLHLEIIVERLRREYNLNLVVTTPSVTYRLLTKEAARQKKEPILIYSPTDLPDPSQIEALQEQWVRLEILVPNQYLGAIMQLLEKIEATYKETTYLSVHNLLLIYETPLREIVVDFYDKLKSVSAGYASMSYNFLDFRTADLVRLDILAADEKVDAFSRLVPRNKAYQEGRALVQKLKEYLPAQLFTVALQAAVGGQIIARETIKALKKDVTGYLYGGDVSRKKKLWAKQKKGKKRMKAIGRVSIPQEVFLKMLKR